MNTSITSREAILETCRQLVSEKGLSSLNIRAVANACKVATGSLYYYFPSKDDLLIATIESVWEHIFRIKDSDTLHLFFPEYINQCFQCIQSGAWKYPKFFLRCIQSVLQALVKPKHINPWDITSLK